ncbi:glycosyltransferase family 4 protein [Halorubrum ezzemoulense]|uniref:glycosyltransferase family 4 protein n=1 Tax=Halorubrum ezzemoulense TaxID=337243 RepID=UPI0023302790|nr:glycosyltransferase family 4 protein [Halorubrum ezzemoulense]MDB9253342.1 glycosyltransferase family 4 protein [Halorubrum ezzemoulense]MDB9256293.1 glycosyltransferase family 4 protein [Halorubrum ezzemoulense]MDB9277659.1 glycosyltransferase family 4 protein [Halorubrum ezzemoulense]
MTRVLHLITRFIDGGAESVVENQMYGLLDAKKDYDVHLGFGNEYDQGRVDSIEEDGIKVYHFDQIRHYSLGRTIPAVLQVKRYLEENQIDLIHTHSTEAGIIGRWAGMLARTPVIIHEIHGDPITQDRSFLLNAFVWLMEWLSAPIASKIVVGADQVRETFLNRRIGTETQYEVIYDGIDIKHFENASPTQLSESDADLQLLFVGRLENGKGLFDLIEAFNRLEGHNVDLIIAGDGKIKSELKRSVQKKGLEQSVHLLGYREDVPELLAASDVLVLPSYREGTPRVISEALASRTPIISTRIAGIPEQVPHGECGLLIEPGDVDALVDALDRLLSSEGLRQRMSESCRSQVERFSIEREQREIVKLYNKHLSNDKNTSH